jgi:hypothetical protein
MSREKMTKTQSLDCNDHDLGRVEAFSKVFGNGHTRMDRSMRTCRILLYDDANASDIP